MKSQPWLCAVKGRRGGFCFEGYSKIAFGLHRKRAGRGGRPDGFINCGSRASGVSNRAAGRLGLTTVLCTLDLVCTKGSAEDIFKRTEGNTNGGDILLAEPTAAFSKALPYILDYISGKGLTAGSVSGTIYD